MHSCVGMQAHAVAIYIQHMRHKAQAFGQSDPAHSDLPACSDHALQGRLERRACVQINQRAD